MHFNPKRNELPEILEELRRPHHRHLQSASN
jgi:hypothetical protein